MEWDQCHIFCFQYKIVSLNIGGISSDRLILEPYFCLRQKSVSMATGQLSNGCYGNHIFVSDTNPLPWQPTTLATVAMATIFLSPTQIRCHGTRPP
jgi:hypothetical protein